MCGNFYLRQLHAHENSGHEEAEEYTDKTNEKQQEAVEFGNVGCIGAVQNYEAQTPHCEQETGSQSLHDVLAIHSAKQILLDLLRMIKSSYVTGDGGM